MNAFSAKVETVATHGAILPPTVREKTILIPSSRSSLAVALPMAVDVRVKVVVSGLSTTVVLRSEERRVGKECPV